MSAIGMPRTHLPEEGATAAAGRLGLGARIAEFFGLDSEWVRPRPALERRDAYLVLGVEAVGLTSLELMRSIGVLEHTPGPWWLQWLAIGSGAILLLWRRRHPLLVALLAAAHMFVLGITMPMVMGQMTLQVAYFIAFFSAVAWARDRRAMLLVVSAIVTFMLGWLVWQFAVGSGVQDIVDQVDPSSRPGVISPIVAGVALTFLVNVIFFAAAIVSGQFFWRAARQQARVLEQASTIQAQTEALKRQAVVDERLRIARELHDVVGHHIAVIGVQAGAARRVLTKDPVTAATALSTIETSSRDAVNQMRGLLGTLRDIEETAQIDATSGSRAPEPTIADLPSLVDASARAGLEVTHDLVEDSPGAAANLPGPVSLTLYRIAQEALANVARHSTARSARLVVRVESLGTRPFAEVEVNDDGRPRAGTSGSGLGQLGMRERAQSLGGTIEIGPRATGGYRVRIRIPLGGTNESEHG